MVSCEEVDIINGQCEFGKFFNAMPQVSREDKAFLPKAKYCRSNTCRNHVWLMVCCMTISTMQSCMTVNFCLPGRRQGKEGDQQRDQRGGYNQLHDGRRSMSTLLTNKVFGSLQHLLDTLKRPRSWSARILSFRCFVFGISLRERNDAAKIEGERFRDPEARLFVLCALALFAVSSVVPRTLTERGLSPNVDPGCMSVALE